MSNKNPEVELLKKKVETLSTLLDINTVLALNLDIIKLLPYVMSVTAELLQAEGSSVILIDREKNELYFEIAHGKKANAVSRIRMPISQGIAGWVIKEKKAIIVNNVKDDTRFNTDIDGKSGFTTRSIIATPLTVKVNEELEKNKIIGVLEVVNKVNNEIWTTEDLEILEILANQVATSIETTLLIEKLKTTISQLKK
ncbi:MAG: GAF domain-containing protein [Candidatus Firestonebacteria bacterium]